MTKTQTAREIRATISQMLKDWDSLSADQRRVALAQASQLAQRAADAIDVGLA